MISSPPQSEKDLKRDKSKNERSESSHQSSHVNESSFHDGVYETNEVNEFLWKKQANEFIIVKIVLKLNFRIEKVIFIVFYVKDVNKSVPYNPFFKKFHLLKSHVLN